MPQVKPSLDFKLLHPLARLPVRSTEEAAGMDVHAFCLDHAGKPSKLVLPTRFVRAIPTMIALKPPIGHVALVCSRSGLARDRSIFVANAPGVIDPDYTGELLILLYNGGHETQYVEHDQRIAQILVVQLPSIAVRTVESFPETSRGTRGFGSTGT